MTTLWTKEKEIEFFEDSRNFASPEQLFYVSSDDHRYFAYWPKAYKGKKTTLQSRNSLIGKFTENFSKNLFKDYAISKGYYTVQGVVCEEIGLSNRSPADVAFCKSNSINQNPDNIIAIFEVKMSIVWNWELINENNTENVICIGDYKTHKGNPGLLRSDSMLKAIGKSAVIRSSGFTSSHIPIIILGNTPIQKSYYKKVDLLKQIGFIQAFWSVNPSPLDDSESLKSTPKNGFIKFDSINELEDNLDALLSENIEFFSSMKSKNELGRIIEIANKEIELEKKAEKFLSLIRS
ncbi:MAG: hypothetical protein ACFFC1_11285 [Promethearchaeota archaeon]